MQQTDEIQFDIQNIFSYIETLFNSAKNPTFISHHDLQYLLSDIKDQLRSNPWLNLSANIELDIWSYYKFLKIQAFVLTDTLLSYPLYH